MAGLPQAGNALIFQNRWLMEFFQPPGFLFRYHRCCYCRCLTMPDDKLH